MNLLVTSFNTQSDPLPLDHISRDGVNAREKSLHADLLAPVWTLPSVYPSMDMSKFDPSLRRQAQRARILDMDSDIILMQECQKSQLDLLMSEDDGILLAKYSAFGLPQSK